MVELIENDGRFRVLALLWHSPHSAVTAGGFKRTYELFKRIPAHVSVYAVDNSPSFLATIRHDNLAIDEYHIPHFLRKLEECSYKAERMTERVLSFALIVLKSLRLRMEGYLFDAVYIPYSEIVTMLVAGVVAKLVFRKRLVLCNHNIEHYSAPLRLMVVALHNRADTVIAVSKDLKDKLVRYGVRVPIVVNSNGLDTEYIESVIDGTVAEKIHDGVFVGRHVQEKGILDLVEAWCIVTDRLPSAKLLLMGSCDAVMMARLTALLEKHGIEKLVTIRGIVSEEEKYKLIRESKVLLFPSYMEGWGLVPQEALACGLPVVLYDLSVYAENINQCEAVFTVPIGDYREMAWKTIELLEDNVYLDYGAVGPDFVKRFSWDDIADAEFQMLIGCFQEGGY